MWLKLFKKTLFIISFLSIFSYILIQNDSIRKILRLLDENTSQKYLNEKYNSSPAYIVDTPGCQMPFFEVMNKDIAQFMKKEESYSCGKSLIRASDDVAGELHLNMGPHEIMYYYNIRNKSTISCKYMEIRRKTDETNEFLPQVPFKLEPVVRLPANLEFIQVECHDPTGRRIYVDFFFFAIDKNKTMSTGSTRSNYERISLNDSEPHRKAEQAPYEGLSVMILGIDSISHLNFLRQMPKTSDYIKKYLSHVEFWGFNKVGDNTFPNLMPLLSGLNQDELFLSCVDIAKQKFDRCSFIWKNFKRANYSTVFAEDVAEIAAFNNDYTGFWNPPTDYYLRPIMLAMESAIGNKQDMNVNLCLGARRTADVLLEYIRKLIPKFQKEFFLSIFWTVTLTHDFFNTPTLLDEQMANLLEKLKDSGVLNKTLVLLMSDHGLRYGAFRETYQGMLEERLPLLMVLYPEWLAKRYPEAVENLKLNSKRLTTHFDLHATMLQLLDMRSLEKENLKSRAAELKDPNSTLPRGISLFLPVPVERTCEQANIAAHWCTCHQRQEMQTNDGRVQRAARYLVRFINDRLKGHPKCGKLYLYSILKAFIAAPHHKILIKLENDYAVYITLRLQTKPGLGIFESTIRMTDYTSTVTGTISRINLYRNQSYCNNDSTVKMFCYCQS